MPKETKSGLPEPMLAQPYTEVFPAGLQSVDFSNYYVMPKLDGIRAITYQGKLWTRNGKEVRNKYVQAQFCHLPDYLDGELYIHGEKFHDLSSMIMGGDNPAGQRIEYHIFDTMASVPSNIRYGIIAPLADEYNGIYVVSHTTSNSYEEFIKLDDTHIDTGYEGSMLKHKYHIYKHGRAGKKNTELVKVKRVETAEIKVTGVAPLLMNLNEATTDEYGRTKRSQSKEGKVEDTTRVGKLIGTCITKDSPFYGQTIQMSGCISNDEAKQLMFDWNDGKLEGRIAEFKYYAGGKDTARQPIFLRFRPDLENQ
jgi:DNA ligase-1